MQIIISWPTGDCYVCTTVEEMLPAIVNGPAEYNAAERKVLNRPATIKDIAEFVTEYIYSDVSLLL